MAIFNDDFAFNSIIGSGSIVTGDIKIQGSIRIDGDLDGNLECTSNVNIGTNARVNGNISAKSITVGGVVKGNILAPDSVTLMASSLVIGDIQTHRLQAEEDVVIHGHCIALRDESLYTEAVNKWQSTQAIVSRTVLSSLRS